jgi:hypothetical protein
VWTGIRTFWARSRTSVPSTVSKRASNSAYPLYPPPNFHLWVLAKLVESECLPKYHIANSKIERYKVSVCADQGASSHQQIINIGFLVLNPLWFVKQFIGSGILLSWVHTLKEHITCHKSVRYPHPWFQEQRVPRLPFRFRPHHPRFVMNHLGAKPLVLGRLVNLQVALLAVPVVPHYHH